MNTKKLSRLLMAIIVLMFAVAVSVPSKPAYAGGNGQQLEIKGIMAKGAKVTVSGYNQNGKWVTWTGLTSGTPSEISPSWGETLKTNNWWWVGRVEVRVYVSGNVKYSCYKDVPKSQSSDWVSAALNVTNALKTSPQYACG